MVLLPIKPFEVNNNDAASLVSIPLKDAIEPATMCGKEFDSLHSYAHGKNPNIFSVQNQEVYQEAI